MGVPASTHHTNRRTPRFRRLLRAQTLTPRGIHKAEQASEGGRIRALRGLLPLGDVEAEGRLALEDFVVVVVVLDVCGAELRSRIEIAEALERVVGLERLLGQDEEVGLARSGVVAVHPCGLAERLGDPLL